MNRESDFGFRAATCRVVLPWAAAFAAWAIATASNDRATAAPPRLDVDLEVMQLRVLASPQLDAAVCKRAVAQQETETEAGRPWSTEVYRDVDGKKTVAAKWYRCANEFAKVSSNNTSILLRKARRAGGEAIIEVLALEDEPQIDRGDFETVRPGVDGIGKPCVNFTMTKAGGEKLFKMTQARLPTPDAHYSHLAIIIEGEVISAPRLQSAIRSDGQISGNFTEDEVAELADRCNGVRPVKKPDAKRPNHE